MKALPASPSIYNTRGWLTEVSRSLGRAATLDDIPDYLGIPPWSYHVFVSTKT